ncbi:MAG: Fe2+-dependent dioxygenase [Alphaproteobacteria bacterium]
MILHIPEVLGQAEVARFRERLGGADWADGAVTAGYQSALAKHNLQLPENSETARILGHALTEALGRCLLFQAAALPESIYPPLFSRYEPGHDFGAHVDNAWRPLPGGGRIRTDLSATLFLSDPDSYDGGELVIEDMAGDRPIRLPAGDMILYPSTSLHRVAPVTRGERLAAIFWVQSLVARADERSLLLDMDLSIQSLRAKVGDGDPALIALTGAYHNLLRLWSR